jgi:hypothetical protein
MASIAPTSHGKNESLGFQSATNLEQGHTVMAAVKFVSYLRVSTDKQGRSGLGLEAQREAVLRYLNGGQWKLVAEYVEVESGKRNSRPQLQAAISHAKAWRKTGYRPTRPAGT